MDTLNLIPCPVLVTDRHGVIAAVNSSLLALAGKDETYWIGRSMEDLLPTPSRIFLQTHLWPMVLRDGQLAEIKLEVMDASGGRTPVLVNCKRSEQAGVESFHWVLFVSRERSRFEVELLEARKRADAASQSKGQFLANMSHEIRTPMNAILGMLSLLHNTELTPRQKDYASKTEGAAKSLLGLLNDILDFSKVDAGKMTLEREPLRLDDMLRHLSVVLSANVGAKNIEVLFDVDPNLPEVVVGDALRLQQVLINLGGNAIKFTTQGQVVLALAVQARSEGEVSIRFSVQDSGIGIAPEHLEHIFSGFSQAEASTTRRFGGTGLGLAICKRLVELMGGQIQITSALGVGSTFAFTITLPVASNAASAVDLVTPPVRHALVVDDHPIAGALLLRMVQSLGWSADWATSGAQALEMVAKQAQAQPTPPRPYDVVYMDWQMPGMDGWDTTGRMQQWCAAHGVPAPYTVMVTAHGRETLSQRSPEEQAMLHGFLVKPLTALMLREAADEAADGSNRVRSASAGRSSRRQLNGMRILVVEDNLLNQQVAEELLANEGALVSLAANGLLGVEAVRAAAPQFDVVLMDIQMPVLDGYGATQRIREDLGLNDLPIVAMTANAMPGDREVCLAHGMNEHVGKPFDMGKLVSVLVLATGFVADRNGHYGTASAKPCETAADIPGLDLGAAIARMSGLTSLYVRSARDFAKTLPAVVADLQPLLQIGAYPQARMLLHTLKGNAGTLGATALAQEAARLEALCAADRAHGHAPPPLDVMEALAQSTSQALHQAVDALGPPDSAPQAAATHSNTQLADTSPVLHKDPQAVAALKELAALLQEDDLAALQRFAELRVPLQTLPQASLDAMEEALQNLDLDGALTICRECIGNG